MRVSECPAAVPSTEVRCDRCGERCHMDVKNISLLADIPDIEVVCMVCIVPDFIKHGSDAKMIEGISRQEFPEVFSEQMRRWTIETFGV